MPRRAGGRTPYEERKLKTSKETDTGVEGAQESPHLARGAALGALIYGRESRECPAVRAAELWQPHNVTVVSDSVQAHIQGAGLPGSMRSGKRAGAHPAGWMLGGIGL